MSHNARDEALSAFRDDKSRSDVQILIASLKCGGTGLNLTVASRVICVDLWFNKCVEQQGERCMTILFSHTNPQSFRTRVPRRPESRNLYYPMRCRGHG